MSEESDVKAALLFWMNRIRVAALELGPYAAAALVIPGGSVIAALVWFYRHRKSAEARS